MNPVPVSIRVRYRALGRAVVASTHSAALDYRGGVRGQLRAEAAIAKVILIASYQLRKREGACPST